MLLCATNSCHNVCCDMIFRTRFVQHALHEFDSLEAWPTFNHIIPFKMAKITEFDGHKIIICLRKASFKKSWRDARMKACGLGEPWGVVFNP